MFKSCYCNLHGPAIFAKNIHDLKKEKNLKFETQPTSF